MIKVALCLFGSVGFKKKPDDISNEIMNPKFCFNSFKSNLMDLYNTDVFFHTWSSEYDQDLKNLYKPKDFIIENQINFDNDLKNYSFEFIEYYDEVYDLKLKKISPRKYYQNFIFRTKSRWHSQIKSLEILKKNQIKNQTKYDLIIQSRFDLFIRKKLELNNLEKNCIHLVNQPNQQVNKLYDILFVSNYENAMKFTKLKDKLNKYPICPTDSLPIFFKEENIITKKTFKFKDIILYRYYLKYYEINILIRLFNLFISSILKILSRTINILKKIFNYLNSIIN